MTVNVIDRRLVFAAIDDVAEFGYAGPINEWVAQEAQKAIRARGTECVVEPHSHFKGYFTVRRANT